jgi:FtsZ-binding cell division protein ZapB
MAAYEVLGGDPFYDLQVRSKNEPVYRIKGTETVTAKVLSNGEPIPQSALADAPSGNAVRDIKAWMSDDMERLERLERKVRRMVDYSDQLQDEIDALGSIGASIEVDGSLENLVATVQQLLSDPAYRAIADDLNKDPFGKFTYAPMSSYEPGNRTPTPGVSVERTNSGYVKSGENG